MRKFIYSFLMVACAFTFSLAQTTPDGTVANATYQWKENAYITPPADATVVASFEGETVLAKYKQGSGEKVYSSTIYYNEGSCSYVSGWGSECSVLVSDFSSFLFPDGFSFPYNGKVCDRMKIGADGLVFLYDATAESSDYGQDEYPLGYTSLYPRSNPMLAMRFMVNVLGSQNGFTASRIEATANSKIRYWIQGESPSRILVVDFSNLIYSNEGMMNGSNPFGSVSGVLTSQIQMHEDGRYVFAMGTTQADDITVNDPNGYVYAEGFNGAFKLFCIAGTGYRAGSVYVTNGDTYTQWGYNTGSNLTTWQFNGSEIDMTSSNQDVVKKTFMIDKNSLLPTAGLGIEVDPFGDSDEPVSSDCQSPSVCQLAGSNSLFMGADYLSFQGSITVDNSADSVMFVVVKGTESSQSFTPQNGQFYEVDTVVNEGRVSVDFGEKDYAVFYKSARDQYGWYYYNNLMGLEENTEYTLYVYAYKNVGCENGPAYSPACSLGSDVTPLQNPAVPAISTLDYAEGSLTFSVSATDDLTDSILVAYSKNYPISSSNVSGQRYEIGDVLFQNTEHEGVKLEALFVGQKGNASDLQISNIQPGESYYVYAWSYRNKDTYSNSMDAASYYVPASGLPVHFGPDSLLFAEGVSSDLPWAGWSDMSGWSAQTLDYSDWELFQGNYTPIFYAAVPKDETNYIQMPDFVLEGEKDVTITLDYALVTGGGSYSMQTGDFVVIEYAKAGQDDTTWVEAAKFGKDSPVFTSDIDGVNRVSANATLGEGTWMVRVGFQKATENACFVDFVNLKVAEATDCAQPVLRLTSATDQQAVITWNKVGDGVSYEYRYAKSGESIDAAEFTSVSDSTVTLMELEAATEYTVQVKTKCREGIYSDVSSFKFSTMYNLPYKAAYRDLSEYALLPGFKRYNDDGAGYAEATSGWGVTAAYFREPAGKTMSVSVSQNKRIVQLPALYQDGQNSGTILLSFDLAYNKWDSLVEGCKLNVYLGDEPLAFNVEDTVCTLDHHELNANAGKFLSYAFDISESKYLDAAGPLYVSFEWLSELESSGTVMLDNVYVGAANCGEITSLTVDSVKEESVYFGMESEAFAAKFRYWPVGSEEDIDSTVVVVAESVMIGGLVSNTEYAYTAEPCADMAGSILCDAAIKEGTFTTKAYVCPDETISLYDSAYTSLTYSVEGDGWRKQVHVFGPDFDSICDVAEYAYRVVVRGLKENTKYKATIRSYKGNSFGEWSDTIEHSTRMICPVPVLSHSQVTDASAYLNCSDDAVKFDKELRYGAKDATMNHEKWLANESVYQLEGLTANTTYVYAARTVCAEGDTSAWSADASFATLPEAGQCEVPTLLDTVSVGTTTATFEVESEILAKQLYIFTGSEEEGLTFEWNDEDNFTATGLAEGTEYLATVRAVCGADTYSDWSDTITFTTKVSPCEVPTGFKTVNVATTSATFTTDALGAKEIVVYAASATMDEKQAKVWAADEEEFSWTGLTEGTEYKAVVRAVCSETRKSEWSAPISFTTEKEAEPEVCGVPTALSAEADTLSASLKWTAGENNVSFEVRYKKAEDTEYKEIASNEATIELTGLDAKTAYVWSVRGVCEEGKSDFATDAQFTTLGKEVSNEAPEAIRFQVLAQNGMVHVINPDMNYIERVQIHSINGGKVADVVIRSNDNVSIPVQGGRVVLVSVFSNGYRATYKVFVR